MASRGKAYSDDLRWHIVHMKAMNMSDADIAARFMVSRRTVQRYVQRYVITGTVSPFQKCNGPVRMLTATEDTLISALLDRPSLYLH